MSSEWIHDNKHPNTGKYFYLTRSWGVESQEEIGFRGPSAALSAAAMNQDIQEVIKVFIYNVSEKDAPVTNNTISQAASYTTRRWKMRFRGSQPDLGNWYWWRSRGLEFKRVGFKIGDQKGPKTRDLRWFLQVTQQAHSRAGWRTQLSTLPIHRLDSTDFLDSSSVFSCFLPVPEFPLL